MRTVPIDTPLGHELKQLRAARAIPQKEVSRRSGYSTGYLSRIENGLCAPADHALLEKIALALELSESEKLKLIDAARDSRLIVHLPTNGSWKAYANIHRLIRLLPKINDTTWATIEMAVRDVKDEGRSSMPVS
jgi:transcriptional regulator with XRE-family HTH domain